MKQRTSIGDLEAGVLFWWVLFALFLGVAYCGALDGFAGMGGTISIAGGTTHIPVMNDAAKNIMAVNR